MHPPRGNTLTNGRAAHLRRNLSPPEGILWSRLRRKQLGVRFRRQRPLGPYILDFYCVEARLCIEVDGEHHRSRSAHDAGRDAYLRQQGVKTVRYSAQEVTANVDGVARHIERIATARIAAFGVRHE